MIKIKSMDLVAFIKRQRRFSLRAFGEGKRAKGIAEHIHKELEEVDVASGASGASGDELAEWVDVILLAIDGAQRCEIVPAGEGKLRNPTAEEICLALFSKLQINETRKWPALDSTSQDRAIEHLTQ